MSSDPPPGSRWFYVQNGRRQGPVDLPRLIEVLLSLDAPDEALIWQPGMPEWVKASSLEAVRRELPPPVPRAPEQPSPEAAPPPPVPEPGPGAPETAASSDGRPLAATPSVAGANDDDLMTDEGARQRRRRHRHKKGVIRSDFRPYLLPLLVLLLTMVVALWWLLRRVNEVPPGRILLQGAIVAPGADRGYRLALGRAASDSSRLTSAPSRFTTTVTLSPGFRSPRAYV
jgi:GYF domain 2